MEHRSEQIFQPCTKYPEGKSTVKERASKIEILIFDERWNAPSDPVQKDLGIHVFSLEATVCCAFVQDVLLLYIYIYVYTDRY